MANSSTAQSRAAMVYQISDVPNCPMASRTGLVGPVREADGFVTRSQNEHYFVH